MLYIQDKDQIRQIHPSIVTIGKFDGFHRGHRKILREAEKLRKDDRQVVVFTFSRSPQQMMAGQIGANLNTHREKLRMAEQFGVDVVVEYPFTEEVRHIRAEQFLEDILLDQLSACAVVAGPDCCFGYERQGNVEFLRARAQRDGFTLRVVEKERYEGEPISSTRIREALARGEAERAADMLGYPYGYHSAVVHGRQLGRSLGFPTVNQDIPPEKIVPALGVYAAEADYRGKRYAGITNVGIHPTVGRAGTASVETYLFDFEGEIYGQDIRVDLKHFIRPERPFSSVEELRQQVLCDIEKVRKYWADRLDSGKNA